MTRRQQMNTHCPCSYTAEVNDGEATHREQKETDCKATDESRASYEARAEISTEAETSSEEDAHACTGQSASRDADGAAAAA
jgi:hypothetical protein